MFTVSCTPLSVTEPGSALSTTLFAIRVATSTADDTTKAIETLLQTVTATTATTAATANATTTMTNRDHGFAKMFSVIDYNANLTQRLSKTGWAIFRRYSEVVAFRRYLALRFAGHAVPHLAPKGSSDQETGERLACFFSDLSRLLARNPTAILENKLVATFLVAPRVYREKTTLQLSAFVVVSSSDEASSQKRLKWVRAFEVWPNAKYALPALSYAR